MLWWKGIGVWTFFGGNGQRRFALPILRGIVGPVTWIPTILVVPKSNCDDDGAGCGLRGSK